MKLSPKKTALVVIDVQNDFCSSRGVMAEVGKELSYSNKAVQSILSLIKKCKEKDIFIIYIQTIHHNLTNSSVWRKRGEKITGICESEWGRSFYKIDPNDADYIMMKNRYDAFLETNFDLILRSQGIENLVFTGVTTNVCVESTVRHGFMLNYNTTTLSDGTASYSKGEHESALFNIKNYFGEVMEQEEFLARI